MKHTIPETEQHEYYRAYVKQHGHRLETPVSFATWNRLSQTVRDLMIEQIELIEPRKKEKKIQNE